MNLSEDDSRALNTWQKLCFNAQSSNTSPSSRADAWRRLLIQIHTLKRRLVDETQAQAFWSIKCTALSLIVIVPWAIFIYSCRDVTVERYVLSAPSCSQLFKR